MTTIPIIMTCALIAAVIIAIYNIRHPSYCRNCGSRMDRYFDPEEDAEVYQCPCCGRSYIIK